MSLNYDHLTSYDRCLKAGLKWDADGAASFDVEAYAAQLTQEQFDAMLWAYIWRMKFYWTPENYSFKGRLAIAGFFVFHPVYAFFKRGWDYVVEKLETLKEAFELRKL